MRLFIVEIAVKFKPVQTWLRPPGLATIISATTAIS